MKPLLQLLGNLVFAVATVLGVLFVVANISGPEPEPHRFQGLYTAGLWTSQPTRVDPSSQTLERVSGPVLASAVAPAQPAASPSNVPDAREVASLDPSAGMDRLDQADLGAGMPSAGSDAALQAAHVTWCTQRYRSYDQESDTYRSFSGQRRPCLSPYVPEAGQASLPAAVTGSTAGVTLISTGTPSDDHTKACLQRYRSYRMEDNTYQPLDGGPRRTCHLS